MKKLTAGIFTVLIGLCAANSADASVASTGWVEEQVGALATTVGTNKTEAANALSAAKSELEGKITAEAGAREAADNALTAKIGTLPEGSADVVAYINKKTEGIATDAALGELQTQVSGNTNAITTLNGSGEGSVAKTIADYVTGLNLANTYGAKSAVEANASAIADIEGSAYATSGITSDKVSTYDGYAAQINAKEAAANKVSDFAAASSEDKDSDTKFPTTAFAQDMIDATVASTTQQVNSLNQKLTALQGTVSTNATTASDATAAVAQDLSDYQATNDAAVKANADAITGINSELDTMATSETVTALTGRVTTAEGEIDTLQGTVGDSTKGLVKAAADNAAAAAAAAQQASDNAALIQANTNAIAAEEARAKAAEQANAAAAKAADDKAVAAQATADAAIPKPTEDCTTLGAKCVLTVGNSGYVWESIERADGENVQ